MKYRWVLNTALLALCLFIPSSSFGQSIVTCNSDDEKRHSCAADTRGGVRLQNQRSGSPCTEGYSWGYDEQGIWVDHGCRAEFAVGGPDGDRNRDDRLGNDDNGGDRNRGYGPARIIACNSDDEKRHYCAADTRDGVHLQNQRSGSPCTEGYSWGYDEQGIWVDHGCRAEFAVGGRGGYRNRDDRDGNYDNRGYGNRGYGQAQIITCNSDDEKRHYCAADTSRGVQLQNQRSGSPCTEGYSWGADEQGIWVDHGCRASFTLGGGRGDYGNGGYRNRGYGQAQIVACNSNDEKRHYCAADTRGGVRIQRQRSGTACVEGSTWGYDDQGIWVDRGCRADFAVGAGRGRYRNPRQRRR